MLMIMLFSYHNKVNVHSIDMYHLTVRNTMLTHNWLCLDGAQLDCYDSLSLLQQVFSDEALMNQTRH